MYITSQCSISVPDATITMQILSWFLADVLNIRIVLFRQNKKQVLLMETTDIRNLTALGLIWSTSKVFYTLKLAAVSM